ncbi:GGDEF domain-containing protein [Pannonibacter sp. Pt2-lr]
MQNARRDFQFLSNGIDVPDHEIEFRGAHYLVSVTLLALEAAEEFPAVFVTLSDISGRKRMEMERAETNRQLSEAYEKIKRLAATDPLTGVLNRNGLQDLLDTGLGRLQQDNLPVSLGLIDVDWFKRYNDTYGHPAGDAVLQQVASLISGQIRSACDAVARYGERSLWFSCQGPPLSRPLKFFSVSISQLQYRPSGISPVHLGM